MSLAVTRTAALLAAATLLAGCGYVGEPLPPALLRPMRVTDLAAVERGSKIVVQFTLPKLTTEGLTVPKNQDVELRYGVSPVNPFRYDAWEPVSTRVADVPQDHDVARVEIPAEPFAGKYLVIGVKVHGPHGRDIGWSNMVSVPVVTPLPTPLALEARNVGAGVRLDWHAPAPQFRVFRRVVNDPNWVEIGTSDHPFFVDSAIEYGKSYQYFVQTIEKTGGFIAESDLSETISFKPVDTFPPGVPTGLTAVPGARSIELLWDRNPEKDIAGYRIYRDGKRLTDTLPSPAYSDKTVQPGTRYKYQVSSVDTAGNESAPCALIESYIP